MDDWNRKVRFGDAEIPAHWLMGDAELEIETDSLRDGRIDQARKVLTGVSGRAWLRIGCARPQIIRPRLPKLGILTPADSRFVQSLEVVDEVAHPETQIGLDAARAIQSDVVAGESITLAFDTDRTQLRDIVELGRGVKGWLDADPATSRFLVEFTDLTVEFGHADGLGRVTDGIANYPIVDRPRGPIEIDIAGFTIVASALTVDLKGVHATAVVRLPPGVTDAASCGPATIDLGVIRLSPTCDYYVDAPTVAYGPWLIGDTGMVVEGTGYVLDLSTTRGTAPRPPTWRGLVLGTGSASGAANIPDPCNSGYLRGTYGFDEALVIASGFLARAELAAPVEFTAINPFGETFSFREGWLQFSGSAIVLGQLLGGGTGLVTTAVCEGTAGAPVVVRLPVVSVQADFDLTGTVDHKGRRMSWGELTHVGDEVPVWASSPKGGYLFLPGGAVPGYSPVRSGSFTSPNVVPGSPTTLAELKSLDVSGVTFYDLGEMAVASPDRPGGRTNPIKLDRVNGWLRVGAVGVDGSIARYGQGLREGLGDPAAAGYDGVTEFDATLFDADRKNLLGEFVASAAWDSHFSGHVELPAPTHLTNLAFAEMKLTSTASIVGGDITLPTAGVPLEYWDVSLVPTGPPNAAGVLSIRTGRVLFTAAGIAEPRHFAQPFGLTWGEILANGALGELYLNFVDWGQRFDGLVFHPAELTLSAFDPADPKPYLGVAGEVCFPFFGMHHINVRDAVETPAAPGPPRPFPRHVTVPKTAITPHSAPTDLALTGIWHDVGSAELAHFELPDAQVDYNEAFQEGFIGTGGGVFSFLHSDPLDVQVEIHSDATDVRFTSLQAHGLEIDALARLGALSQIAGNLRIEGPTLRSMTVYGMFEQSAAGGILGPKAGLEVEANFTVTPTSLDFYAAGDMLLSLGLVEVSASATAHLFFDFAAGTAEGELFGRVDADAAVAGLSGEGQLTWFLGPSMQYLQGRLKVKVFSLVGGAALEGGFFVGNNVPNALAWALDTSDPKFGMSRAIMPASISGVYGYGRASFGFNAWVLGGGIDIFVGAGAFSTAIGGSLPAIAGAPLPYVVGACGVNVHGEILGGLVSASAWGTLSLRGPVPTYFEGTIGLRGCVAWVLCASVSVTARFSDNGFELF